MKSVIIAAVILALVLGCAAWNGATIGKEAQLLLDKLNRLPEQMETGTKKLEKQVDTIYTQWDRAIRHLSYTVGFSQINRADTAINTLYIAYYCENTDDYAIARREAIDAVTRLHRLQALHYESIL